MDETSKILAAVQAACSKRDFALAKEICDQAGLTLPNEAPTIFWFKAIISNREGNLIAERNFLEEALATKTKNRAIFLAYGNLLLRLGLFKEAIECFESLIGLDVLEGDSAFTQISHLRLAYCFYALGAQAQAVDSFERVGPLFGNAPVKYEPLVTYDDLKMMISTRNKSD